MTDHESKNPKKRKIQESNNNDSHEESKQEPLQTDEPFSFYSLMNISRTATLEEIKKAYKGLALKYHPDKNPNSADEARKNFQKVTEAYQILIDPEKRKMYDETGTIDSGNLDDFMNAYKYFRSLYKKIEKEDIDDFSKKYRDSDLEKEDLINFFKEHNGDIKLILESIPLSRNEDIGRFLKFYDEMIEEKKLENYKKYPTSRKRIKKLKEEDDEWEDDKNEEFEKLTKAITLKNKGNFENYFDTLEKKYAKNKKNIDLELNDEKFDEIQKKLENNKKENLKKIKK